MLRRYCNFRAVPLLDYHKARLLSMGVLILGHYPRNVACAHPAECIREGDRGAIYTTLLYNARH
jgi:hypothetical protein